MRDTHRLACYLQVYEVAVAQRLESLSSLRRSGMQVASTNFGLLPNPSPSSLGSPRFYGPALALQAIFHGRQDYSCPAKEFSAAASPKTRRPTMRRWRHDNRQWILRRVNRQHQGMSKLPFGCQRVSLKTAIPERYMKPWEFKATRDEALYDMNVRATFAGWIQFLKQLAEPLDQRSRRIKEMAEFY